MIALWIKAGEIDRVDWQVDRELFCRRLRKGFYGPSVVTGPPWPDDYTGVAVIDGRFPVGSALDFLQDLARRGG